MKAFRLKQMEQYIIEHGTASMEELCEYFNVSINTVRMDIAEIVKKGAAKKIYGGVQSVQANRLIPYAERDTVNYSTKLAIGAFAANFIDDGDVIFIDSGTTTVNIIRALDPKKHVSVITYSLIVLNAAEPNKRIEVICLPGRLDRKTRSFADAETTRFLERYNIKKSFMATTGISSSGAVTNSSLIEHEIKSFVVRRCESNYLLMDSTKYDKPSLTTYATLDQMTGVITDGAASQEMRDLCDRLKTKLWIAPPIL